MSKTIEMAPTIEPIPAEDLATATGGAANDAGTCDPDPPPKPRGGDRNPNEGINPFGERG